MISSGKGELPAVKIGGRWKIRAEDIEKYLLKKNANSASNLQKLEIITNNRRSGSPQKKGGENQNTETISNEQAIRLDPGYADAYISKADALHSLRRYEEALAAYEQAICLNPDNIHAYKGKADALHSLQHYKEALAAYEQAIRLDPDNPASLANLATNLMAQNKGSDAAEIMKRAVGIYNTPALRTLG